MIEILETKSIPIVELAILTEDKDSVSIGEEPVQQEKLPNEKHIEMKLQDNKLSIWLNDKKVINKLAIN
ncbi:hypothetical protein [Sporosarcina ureae]|uniref:hypothetical protein n=1 Tax=Sporosarcina ureae TaxID=1571 RepID=UPI0026EAECD6|nr:hypothetical protein [Sporosarcina ureae]